MRNGHATITILSLAAAGVGCDEPQQVSTGLTVRVSDPKSGLHGEYVSPETRRVFTFSAIYEAGGIRASVQRPDGSDVATVAVAPGQPPAVRVLGADGPDAMLALSSDDVAALAGIPLELGCTDLDPAMRLFRQALVRPLEHITRVRDVTPYIVASRCDYKQLSVGDTVTNNVMAQNGDFGLDVSTGDVLLVDSLTGADGIADPTYNTSCFGACGYACSTCMRTYYCDQRAGMYYQVEICNSSSCCFDHDACVSLYGLASPYCTVKAAANGCAPFGLFGVSLWGNYQSSYYTPIGLCGSY